MGRENGMCLASSLLSVNSLPSSPPPHPEPDSQVLTTLAWGGPWKFCLYIKLSCFVCGILMEPWEAPLLEGMYLQEIKEKSPVMGVSQESINVPHFLSILC